MSIPAVVYFETNYYPKENDRKFIVVEVELNGVASKHLVIGGSQDYVLHKEILREFVRSLPPEAKVRDKGGATLMLDEKVRVWNPSTGFGAPKYDDVIGLLRSHGVTTDVQWDIRENCFP